MKLTTIIFLCICLFSNGCKKFVEVDAPFTQTDVSKLFENSASATGALTSIYAQMVQSKNNNSYPYLIPLYTGLYSDELKSVSTTTEINMMYLNSLNSNTSLIYSFWTDTYNYIYQANAIIEGLNTYKEINATIKKQLIAEATFIRAYWYFYLVNIFGDVPLLTTTNYVVNAKAARTNQADIWNKIIKDLKDAQSNLSENYVNASDTATTSDRFRPNAYTATALLARAYLFKKEFDSAENEATKVIQNISLYDTVPLNSVFQINSKEVIWQLMTPSGLSNNNSIEGLYFILKSSPLASTAFNCSGISNQLMNAFETNDKRKSTWIGTYTDTTVNPHIQYYYPYKYHLTSSTASPQEYSVVFRLAEQYLIRAEARAQLGNISGAQSDLNIIRHRAGLPNTTASTKDALLTAIWHERQVELFCEYGHRWLDLKRTGQVDAVMQQVAPLKGGTWNSDKASWPIPQTEITNDPNLTQNPGYEDGGTGS